MLYLVQIEIDQKLLNFLSWPLEYAGEMAVLDVPTPIGNLRFHVHGFAVRAMKVASVEQEVAELHNFKAISLCPFLKSYYQMEGDKDEGSGNGE